MLPFSLPLSSGKMSAIAVADPVEVGARLTSPDLQASNQYLPTCLGVDNIDPGLRSCNRLDIVVSDKMHHIICMSKSHIHSAQQCLAHACND